MTDPDPDAMRDEPAALDPGPAGAVDGENGEAGRGGPLPHVEGYRVVGLLGRGATGVVYSAIQLAVDRPVALKILHPELCGKKRVVGRLQREARTTARLAHPCIVTAIDMGEQDGRWWYAMELVEGISLAERVEERGPMTEREALRFFIPVCDALQHASEQGVVHRDIKPANLLIDAHGRARLIDLGLAFAEDDPSMTRAGGTLGTPHYISPEQAQDPTAADTRSDIWSLGATLFHAVCGRPPFGGESVAEILTGVLTAPVPEPRSFAPHLSKGLALVLRKCLSRDPGLRYQEPQELLRDLEAIRERRAPRVRAGQLEPVAGQRARRRTFGAAAGAAAVILVVATALLLRDEGPADDETGGGAPLPWPAFQALEASYGAGNLTSAAALSALDRLDEAPEGWEVQRRVLRTRVESELGARLAGLRTSRAQAVESRLAERRYDRAYEELRGELDEALFAETGFRIATLPATFGADLARWRETLRDRIERVEEAAQRRAERALTRHVDDLIRPRFERLLEVHRYRDALAELAPEGGLWAAAGVEEPGLREEARAAAERTAGLRIAALRSQAQGAYYAIDRDLSAFIEAERDALVAGLQEEGLIDAPAALRSAFEREAEARDFVLAQVPEAWRSDGAGRPTGSAARLERACEDLADEEARLLAERAVRAFESDDRRASALCAARAYADAAAFWERRLGEPWRAASHAAIRTRLTEARLGQEVLERVARELLRRGETGEPINPTFDKLRRRDATVQIDGDILRGGFLLQERVPRPEPRRVRVVPVPGAKDDWVLATRDLLEIAGLARIDLDADDRFLRALFLFHEGEAEAALDALPLPDEAFAHRALLPDLEARVQAALEVRDAVRVSRREELDNEIFALKRSQEEDGTTTGRLADLERLLVEYDDLLLPAQRRELETLRGILERPEEVATFEEVYAPDELSVERRDVRMKWEFPAGKAGAWELGAFWSNEGRGLSLLTEARTADKFWSAERALGLPLRPPLDLSSNVRVVLVCELVRVPEAVHGELFLEVAGTGLVIVDEPAGARLVVAGLGPGGGPALVARALETESRGTVPVSRLPRGRSFQISLTFNPRHGGDVELVLDGLLQGGVPVLPRPREFPADPRLVLRSLRALRVLEARIEGRQAEPR